MYDPWVGPSIECRSDTMGAAANPMLRPLRIGMRRTRFLRVPMYYSRIGQAPGFQRHFDRIGEAEGDIVECGVGH